MPGLDWVNPEKEKAEQVGRKDGAFRCPIGVEFPFGVREEFGDRIEVGSGYTILRVKKMFTLNWFVLLWEFYLNLKKQGPSVFPSNHCYVKHVCLAHPPWVYTRGRTEVAGGSSPALPATLGR